MYGMRQGCKGKENLLSLNDISKKEHSDLIYIIGVHPVWKKLLNLSAKKRIQLNGPRNLLFLFILSMHALLLYILILIGIICVKKRDRKFRRAQNHVYRFSHALANNVDINHVFMKPYFGRHVNDLASSKALTP